MTDTPTAVHKIAAEVLGTFVLVFFGCGAALISGGDYVATALAFGLTVVVMAYAVGRISGGHFNPAVTLGAAVGGRLPWREVVLYVGPSSSARSRPVLCLWVLMHGFAGYDSTTDGLAQNSFGDEGATGYAWWAAFLLEALMTFVFLHGHPRRDRQPHRAPRDGPVGDRPGARDDPLRLDQRHRHLGQPRPLHRGGPVRRLRRDHPALAVHPGAAARRRAAPACSTPCSSAATTRCPGSGLRFAARRPPARRARLRRPGPVPAAVEPARRRQLPAAALPGPLPPAGRAAAAVRRTASSTASSSTRPAAVRRLPAAAATRTVPPAAGLPAAAATQQRRPAAATPPQQYQQPPRPGAAADRPAGPAQQQPPQQLGAAGRPAAGSAAPGRRRAAAGVGQPGADDDEDGRTQVRPQEQ